MLNCQHTLHFCDHHLIIGDLPEQPGLEYNSMSGGVVKGAFCHQFAFKEKLKSTSCKLREYSFKNPPYNQQHIHQRQEDNGSAKDYQLYHYAGRYKKDVAGKPFTRYRLEANRVDASTASGMTNAIHLMPGYKLELTMHPKEVYNTKYHLLGVSHHGSQPQALGEEAGDGATTYTASFHAIPARLPYRPPLRVKPLVDGPQIAHITGPPGEEIYTDKYGRVKCWFPWDFRNDHSKDEKTSCWIRVSQNWGGARWGHIALPRIGHEVLVDFLDGDPDQPIITGRTYHNNNMPPYELPDHKTKMVIRSDTHKGSGFNEISFEDDAGREEIYIHGQKDQNVHIENNRSKRIDNNQSESVGHNKSIEIGNNHQETIGGNMHLVIGANRLAGFISSVHKKIGNALLDKAVKIGGQALKLGPLGSLGLGKGNMSIAVGANKAETVAVTSTETVGVNKASIVGGTRQDFTGGSYHSFAGQHRMDETLRTITQVAGERWQAGSGKTSITLDAKSGKITINADLIELNGKTNVTINGGKIKLN